MSKPCPLTEAAFTSVGNDILHALISKNPKHATMKNLPRNFFLESEERDFFFENYKLFHSEDALQIRAEIIAARQLKSPKCFSGDSLIVRWNDRNICENENIRGVRASNAHGGSSSIKGIDISKDDLEKAHRNGMDCFKSKKILLNTPQLLARN